MNLLRDFELTSGRGWSAYLGAGVGVAFLDFNYGNEFLQKTVGEGYLDVPFSVDWPVVVTLNAAGSLSSITETDQESVLTYSVIAGINVYSKQDLTLDFRLSWRVIDDEKHDNDRWRTIRSHAPVIADGRTPF